jgi:hypothetical protein
VRRRADGPVARCHLRAVILDQQQTDPRLVQLFDQWGQQSGLYRAADGVVPASSAQRREAATTRLFAQAGRRSRSTLTPTPAQFVRETLGLRNRNNWVTAELLTAFDEQILTRTSDIQFLTSGRVLVAKAVATIDWAVRFDARPDDSIAEALHRNDETLAEATRRANAARLQLTQAPRRRVPKTRDARYMRRAPSGSIVQG